jgi:hypothetical protein
MLKQYKKNGNSRSGLLALDPLEPRRLMSAPVPIVQNGILKIWGTPGDDTIEVERYILHEGNPGMSTTPFYGIYDDGVTTMIPDGGVVGLHVHAGQGNDVIKLINVDPNLISVPTPTGVSYLVGQVPVPETVIGGQGDDLIDAGYGNPGLIVTGGLTGSGPCALRGGPGNDTISGSYGILYAGQGNDSLTAGFNTTVVAGRGDDTINTGVYSNDVIMNIGGNDTVVGMDTVGGVMPG